MSKELETNFKVYDSENFGQFPFMYTVLTGIGLFRSCDTYHDTIDLLQPFTEVDLYR